MAVLPICFNENDKIAIIAPHPDDECIGCGGIMAKYPSICDVFIVTDGRQGNKNVSPAKEAEIRKKQFEKEMEFAKVNSFYWLGYEDGALMMCGENYLDDIDFSQYTKIFIPWGDDNHADHTAVYECALNVFRKQNIRADVFQYEVHVPFHDVTHYADITDVMKKKETMIKYHTDQVNSIPYHSIAEALAKYRACQGRRLDSYWETFVITDINKAESKIAEREKILQKYQSFYRLLLCWNKLHVSSDLSLHKIISKYGWGDVSIYGYADLGKLLYEELSMSNIRIINILDTRANLLGSQENRRIKLLKPEDGERNVDAVIVTAITHFCEIEKRLKTLGYKNIISLQRLLEEG